MSLSLSLAVSQFQSMFQSNNPNPFHCRGLIQLELPCPKSSPVVASADPDPRWAWDDLFTELQSLENLLGGAPSGARPSPLKHSDDDPPPRTEPTSSKPFVMCISDDDSDESGSDEDASAVVAGTRFSCNDIDFSDSEGSEDETPLTPTRSGLMCKKSLEEGILSELESEHRLQIKEQLRNKLSTLEAYQENEKLWSSSAMVQLDRIIETRREMDRRLDKQYQRKVAEVLDKHLSIIQRDHEQRSQIEERRIRDDAAIEEAKKKEKTLQEEMVRQEKRKAEEEARLRAVKIAEETKRAAIEAENRAAKEAAEKEAARIREAAAAEVASKEALEQKKAASAELHSKEMGITVLAADTALKAEACRLKTYDDVAAKYHTVAQDLNIYARKIHVSVKQISGSLENARTKATALMNIIKNPECPHSFSILMFAKKVVAFCDNPSSTSESTAFACGHVILLLTSQVPTVMDFVLAEFHKACIYTVPKHLQPSHSKSNTKDFWKMVGYQEEDGELEKAEIYLNRVRSYMKFYAALIQTEIDGIKNPHGLSEGWTWLACFLNALPANRATAVALEAFLQMASFALHRRYGRQFRKILNVIQHKFLPALKERDRDQDVSEIIIKLENFLDRKIYEKEPEGRRLLATLLSNSCVPEF